MPIMNPTYQTRNQTNTPPDLKEEENRTPTTTTTTKTTSSASATAPVVHHHELWPKLNENITDTCTSTAREDSKELSSDEDDWEYVSSNASSSSSKDDTTTNDTTHGLAAFHNETKEEVEEEVVELEHEEHSHIHRCESTPAFSSFSSLGSIQVVSDDDDDLSYVVDCASSVDDQSILTTHDDTVLLSHKPNITNTNTNTNTSIKKVPSFKDMIMMNKQKIEDEEKKKEEERNNSEEQRRKDAMLRRKNNRVRIIVTPIKRCAKSTGDLRSLVIHEEEEGYGGGGGGGGAVIHEEEEVLGESDAMEYYNRKSYGSKGRSNGRKIRPDEAKRKEIIIHKKNAQRRAQGLAKGKKK
jgi:hypothetical protein